MADAHRTPPLSDEKVAALAAIGVVKRFAPGERLVSFGAESTEVFYLRSGLVKVVVTSESGNESVFALRPAGSFIGEMSALNGGRRSADVIAVEDTSTIMVTAPAFTRYLARFPEVALDLLCVLSRRLDEMTVRTMLGSRSVKARIARRLIELSVTAEADASAESDAVTVSITHSVLGQWVGASREWTSKALGELKRDGAIRTARGRIIVANPEALRTAALE